jgi:hypothetical protein
MRISNLGGISLYPSQQICSITSADDVGAVSYQVVGSTGPTLSGQIANLQYLDLTPQGEAPYQVTLEYPGREVGAVTVTAKSPDATVAVVYVSPSGSNANGNINGPYVWVTTPQS